MALMKLVVRVGAAIHNLGVVVGMKELIHENAGWHVGREPDGAVFRRRNAFRYVSKELKGFVPLLQEAGASLFARSPSSDGNQRGLRRDKPRFVEFLFCPGLSSGGGARSGFDHFRCYFLSRAVGQRI